MICLTSARFNMKADVLRQTNLDNPDTPEDEGAWVTHQDPDSGEIYREWESNTPDDPDTPEDESTNLEGFKCLARGVPQAGVKASEQFSEVYNAADFVRINYPASVKLTRRDRVTNIRSSDGFVIWLEEEHGDAPTVFSVTGVTPVIDPFGKHIENVALLERIQTQ